MSEPDTVRSAIEVAASNPKVASIVAASTASVGAATQLEIMQGILSIVSMGVGIFTGLVVLAIQLIKLHRNYKAWQREEPEPNE
jgi:hypothetical protein